MANAIKIERMAVTRRKSISPAVVVTQSASPPAEEAPVDNTTKLSTAENLATSREKLKKLKGAFLAAWVTKMSISDGKE